MNRAEHILLFFQSFATEADRLAAREYIEQFGEWDFRTDDYLRSAEVEREIKRLEIAWREGQSREAFLRLDAGLRHLIIHRVAEIYHDLRSGLLPDSDEPPRQ